MKLTLDEQMSLHKELAARIADEGIGGGKRWANIAAAASVGDVACIEEIKALMGDYYSGTQFDYFMVGEAAYAVMSDVEIQTDIDQSIQNTNAGVIPNADEYLANKLRGLRKNSGLTQKEVALRSGIPLHLYQKYENGKRSVLKANVAYCAAIAKAFGITIEELIATE